MKSTNSFKSTILEYLDKRAEINPLFMALYKKPNKNIDDCVTYILNQVQKSGCNGFLDAEVFTMAVTYYENDNVEVGKEVQCEVVVNHKVELTAEEKAEAKEKAIRELIDAEKKILKTDPTKKKQENLPKNPKDYYNGKLKEEVKPIENKLF